MIHNFASQYLDNVPETLVLKGYRHWTIGIATKNAEHWNEAWNLFATMLDRASARPCMDALIIFVKTLGVCAACPLRTLQPSCEGLCRDECLVLGLISGLQHGDEEAVEFCLTTLTCPTKCHEVAFAAAEFAMALKASGFYLVPIPARTLTTIAFDHMPSRAIN